MNNKEFDKIFRDRTFSFSVWVFRFIESLPKTTSTRIIVYQLGKAASSVGANYRAFCRARSYNEKYAKICIVVEEADEVEFWLQNLLELKYGDPLEIEKLLTEALEILKVTAKIKSSLRQ